MSKLSRATLVAIAGIALMALGLASADGGAGAGTLASVRHAKPSASSLLNNALGRARHPESMREMMASAASQSSTT